VLVRIDRDQIASQIHAARIDVEKAIAIEQQARRSWDDLKPEEQYRIKKDVEQARARLAATQSQWSKTSLTSPITGIVAQQDARLGEVATGVVIRVIDPNNFHIESLMSESDVVRMHVGQEAQIVFDAFDDEYFTAKITQIDPEAVVLQDVTYYRILLEIEDVDDRVRSGMSVDVDIIVEEKKDVLNVPLRFVRSDDEGQYVFVASEDDYQKQYVKTGIEGDSGNIEIIEGLSDGQEVFAIYEE
jgi:HlyD family secretion protein